MSCNCSKSTNIKKIKQPINNNRTENEKKTIIVRRVIKRSMR